MSAAANISHWPTAIDMDKAAKTLTVSFESGETFTLPAELLRVESPSAEVQGHSPHEKKTIPGKKNVGFIDLEAVGRYAVKVVFDDMHDSGLFTWDYLYELGHNQAEIWQRYLDALAAQGLSRDPG